MRSQFYFHLFLGQAEGYVKAPEKSTSRVSGWREVFEPVRRATRQVKERHMSVPVQERAEPPSGLLAAAVAELWQNYHVPSVLLGSSPASDSSISD